ncbi:NUDIX hydrolase [Membranihabitans maritimus]|uniref:NUDIX hydrolase n=1 Tax=Membranihabitans maritimus TaxID=2904244 RepID=UPI001F379498|nr:CoA pyrophosphatase [Membranihabitans maritimus]
MGRTNFTFDELKNLIHTIPDEQLPGHTTSSVFSEFSNRNKRQFFGSTADYHPENIQEAGVVLLIHEKRNIPYLTFIKRSVSPQDTKHSGQIAFPGGKKEIGETLRECAFRELEEEIGIQIPGDYNPKRLSPFYVFVSNFMIHPFICLQRDIGQYKLDTIEVDSIIEAPLTGLDTYYKIYKSDMYVRNNHLLQVPHYQLGQHQLWGATAMIFTELLYIIQNHSDE